ncbi:GGDEF/EAL domain-containing response regulator [Undibacterium umbellatum]|uniref:EAL domain-containing protein n=1 Tax=Undibacterium umbellatum TaxID=2762300 RepID=A0ABR6Z4T9_9BURK|nr:EAL domain-containing protein [Undibacterium umbellatum]MBC3906808.1 EAL domain-containing protein [Undibacterium umbellatum]
MAKRILVVTNVVTDALALQDALRKAHDGPYETQFASSLSNALEQIQKKQIDAILVDLSLPDSEGIATFEALFEVASKIPILTLCDLDDSLAVEAVGLGAQGYLTKGHFSSYLVPQSLRNIIQRKAVEQAAYIEKARAEITLNSISDAVIGTDMAGNVDYLNVAAEHMTLWKREEAQGQSINLVMPLVQCENKQAKANPIIQVLRQDKATTLTPGTILLRRDGSEVAIEDSTAPIHDSEGNMAGAVMVFHDVSATQAMAVKMAHLAQHDFLTNLPNRALLNDRIAQAIGLAKRRETHLAILFLDLDNFKHINDSLGHAIGDMLLKSVTERLCACVRSSDTVSRQGGDEFVILVTDDKSAENAAYTAEKLLKSLAAPHSINKHELYVTTSIGISSYPADGTDAETLIKNADTAMYQAKERGRNNFQFFKPEMNVRAVERQVIEANLRLALIRNEFSLHYQPKINLESGAITGAEALLRWAHPQWGMVPPIRFIRIAEDCGVIVPIGRWVLREACAQTKQWQDDGLTIAAISVNISAVEFRRQDFVEGVRTILAETGLSPNCLQLEITESVLMHHAEGSVAILQQLKDMGIQLAVDDFGTGYSSLSYLNQFPIDVLKIDKSFVNDIGASKTDGDGGIVSAVIAMGNSLNQKVIAEGIEKQGQLSFLKAQHCEEGQGYIFSRPLAAEQFAKLLRLGVTAHVPISAVMPN